MEKENKKIKNATEVEYDGIKFKSKLELMAYKTLKENGLYPYYESAKYVLVEGYKPKTPFFIKDKSSGNLKLDSVKQRDITYTPDFMVKRANTTFFIEMKGQMNDTYPIKKKLFRKLLDTMNNVMFFEIKTKRELLQAIKIIKTYCINEEKSI